MSVDLGSDRRALMRIGLAAILLLGGNAAMAQTVHGTATYRERMALPAGAVLEATLEDVSRADAPATTIASARVPSPGNPPMAFTIEYEPAKIVDTHRYVVRARILVAGAMLFTSDTAVPVIAQGSPTTVSLMLRRTSTGQTSNGRSGAPVQPTTSPSLEQTYWRATELAGKPTPPQVSKQEAHLQFQQGGRVTGSDGCNRINGTYQLKGSALTFGAFAATQMACPTTGIEQAFREALKGTARYAITGNQLELFDASGSRVAAFEGRPQ